MLATSSAALAIFQIPVKLLGVSDGLPILDVLIYGIKLIELIKIENKIVIFGTYKYKHLNINRGRDVDIDGVKHTIKMMLQEKSQDLPIYFSSLQFTILTYLEPKLAHG